MGVSLVARVDAVGADGLQLIADRLMRDHQVSSAQHNHAQQTAELFSFDDEGRIP
jgi:hypothetical protein